MLYPLLQKIKRWGSSIANIGITPAVDFPERNKIRMLNIAVAASIPGYCYFITLNFLQNRTVLAGINILLLCGSGLILYINSLRKFMTGRLILSMLGSFLFFTSAIFFRNGAEHTLLAAIIIVIIFFNEKKWVIGLTILNCLLFLVIKVILWQPVIYDSVPNSRVLFNTAWALGIMVLSLLYIKREQDAYQKQIEKNNWELENMNSTKEKLFSIIAHDLRSPIGQLKTLLDLVNDKFISPDKFRELTATIAGEVEQLHGTMDSLLRWSSSQSVGIHAVPEKIALSALVEECILFFKQKAEQKNIRIINDEAGLTVWADRNHLQIVLRNLLSNACKYSYPGGIILIRSFAKKQMVTLQVIDQGTGVPEDLREVLFSREHIESHRGTANEPGTGLGLQLCWEFVEANEGKIRVESEINKGSTFSVELPAG